MTQALPLMTVLATIAGLLLAGLACAYGYGWLRSPPGMASRRRRSAALLMLASLACIALSLGGSRQARDFWTGAAMFGQQQVQHLGELPALGQAYAADLLSLPGSGLSSLSGATGWINSPPLTAQSLRGKVVLVDFWTYSCINCLRSLPYVRAWYDKYKDHGLVVIGVHAPEFDFEKNPANVAKAVHDLGVDYPVAIDDQYAIWNGFSNQYWPAHYFIDGKGHIRDHHYGEGDYAHSEDLLRGLLSEAGYQNLPGGYVQPAAKGAQAADSRSPDRSPETYVGYARAEGFAGGRLVHDGVHDYRAPDALPADSWALAGRWQVGAQQATLESAPGHLVYRFRGRDLHLVLGPGDNGRPVRFRIRLDGKPPGPDHGMDTDAEGNGVITSQRLYQLVRQAHGPAERLFEIEWLDPGAHVYAFTFG
ncbi:thioredoxin family protein [Frateuria aurantia]